MRSLLSHPPAKPGRPRSYTPEQLSLAIAEVRKDNSVPTVEAVRDVLSTRFGVPRTVRSETLAREIATLLEAEEQQQEENLLACLSAETHEALNTTFRAVERAALLAVAKEWTSLSEQDRQRQMAAAQERAVFVGKCADLEADVRDRDERIAALEIACEAERARASALEKDCDRLARELGEQRSAAAALLSALQEFKLVLAARVRDDIPNPQMRDTPTA
jgi:hypothetical protein